MVGSIRADQGGRAEEDELQTIYPDLDAWGRGAGRPQGNERAIRFYRRAGWRLDGTSRTDTGPGGLELPELLMRRPLGPDTL